MNSSDPRIVVCTLCRCTRPLSLTANRLQDESRRNSSLALDLQNSMRLFRLQDYGPKMLRIDVWSKIGSHTVELIEIFREIPLSVKCLQIWANNSWKFRRYLITPSTAVIEFILKPWVNALLYLKQCNVGIIWRLLRLIEWTSARIYCPNRSYQNKFILNTACFNCYTRHISLELLLFPLFSQSLRWSVISKITPRYPCKISNYCLHASQIVSLFYNYAPLLLSELMLLLLSVYR